MVEARQTRCIDYYGVTFDHPVPEDDSDLEVLMIIIETVGDGREYANKYLPFIADPEKYAGKMVLVVPRCC
ncbi:hypothetical protein P152DRAFT_303268 [Eremomyces bilateralis CBS 781.70]|uniref:Uncharacterized protein n=1 Tax=Eremomyces bilateralis CBS 781.70 TaxID=1392243 RepID=A0A6G1G7R2_9PEZI|nr:uncharacterized protein P152DRAFT_303268 [Eremomyces bilateralis CBS 781.70]KAF1814064.1 hypothetical protein P152DRAFT_303268 [Eremomyces bilateralis CBS 781.70]